MPTHVLYSNSTTSVIPVRHSSTVITTNISPINSISDTRQRSTKFSNSLLISPPKLPSKLVSNPKMPSPLTYNVTDHSIELNKSPEFVYESRVRYLQQLSQGIESNVWSLVIKTKKSEIILLIINAHWYLLIFSIIQYE